MLQLTKEGGIVQWRLDKAPRRGKAAIFLPRNDSKFEEGTGLAAMAGSAGSPSVPRKEPHGPVPFETSTSVQSLREANLPLCTGLGRLLHFHAQGQSVHVRQDPGCTSQPSPGARLARPGGALGAWNAGHGHPKPAESLKGQAASSVPSAELPRGGAWGGHAHGPASRTD